MSGACACINIDVDVDSDYFSDMVVSDEIEKCCECDVEIAPGTKHESAGSPRMGAYQTCADCLSMREEFFCQDWHFGMIWGDLDDHLDAIGGQVSSE